MIALHTPLLRGGRWDGDEYFNFAALRDFGWIFAWQRLYRWSPRPVSEGVLWLYDMAVNAAGWPLIAPFLLLLWSIVVAAAVAAIRPARAASAWRLAIALGVVAMFLLGHVINEMFFWPYAAAPYLLAIAATTAATFLLLGNGVADARGRLACALALVLAAGSSETGLFFTLGCCGWLLLGNLRRPAGWYLVPLGLAVGVLILAFAFRVGDATIGITEDRTYFHHLGPSLLAGLRVLPAELAGADPLRPGWGEGWAVARMALLFAGLLGCWRAALGGVARDRHAFAHVAAPAVGIVASLYLSVTAAHYQFGVLCCERHHSYRQCLVVLLLAALARAACFAGAAGRLSRIGGPLCLLAALAIGFAERAPGLFADYAVADEDARRTARDWRAGHAAALPFTFHRPLHGAVLEGLAWPDGHYTYRDGGPWFIDAMLHYFAKPAADVTQ